MRLSRLACCLLFASAIAPSALAAQDNTKNSPATSAPSAEKTPEAARYFRLEFVIQEVDADGKVVNSRSYFTSVSTDRADTFGSIHTGSRIPIVTGARQGSSATEKGEVQYDYLNTGVNINTRNAHQVGRQLGLYIDANLSSLAGAGQPTGPGDPVIRQNSWQAAVLIPIGKPTVVFASDSLENKGGTRLSITATPLE